MTGWSCNENNTTKKLLINKYVQWGSLSIQIYQRDLFVLIGVPHVCFKFSKKTIVSTVYKRLNLTLLHNYFFVHIKFRKRSSHWVFPKDINYQKSIGFLHLHRTLYITSLRDDFFTYIETISNLEFNSGGIIHSKKTGYHDEELSSKQVSYKKMSSFTTLI